MSSSENKDNAPSSSAADSPPGAGADGIKANGDKAIEGRPNGEKTSTDAAPAADAAKDKPKAEPASAPTGFFRSRLNLSSARQALQPKAPPAPPPAAPRKRRREGTLSALSGFLSFLLLLVVAGVFGVIAAMHRLKEPGPLPADKTVFIPPRSDLPEILSQLERENVIDSPTLMQAALLIEGARSKVKPGEYAFRQKVSLREVIDELVAGRQVLHPITIPEGLTSEQIVQRLKDSDLLDGEVRDIPKEGALLPETYKVTRGWPRSKLLQKMQEDQRKLVDQIWRRRAKDLPIKTPHELVTLASIVEKETGKAEERPRVAAVFVNRLKKGMRLQSDPTIIYGIVGGKASLGRGITRSEIDAYTPYNTYAIDGLPPGPIANPGRAALEATANPAASPDLYFVADGTGGHVFAESLDQHSRNVQRWRQIEHDQKARANGLVAPIDADHAAPLTPQPPPPPTLPAKPVKDRHGAAPPRIAPLAGAEDFPVPSRPTLPDQGALARLSRYAPHDALFAIGGVADGSVAAAPAYAALLPARPFFTHDSSQLKAAPGFDVALAEPHPDENAAAEDPETSGMAPESADGRALADEGGVTSYPVSPKIRAEQKSRAARLGLRVGSDELPPDVVGAPDGAPAAYASAQQPHRPRAFDASEGTALDPLKDKSWDLTSAKTVPSAASLK